MAVTEASHGQHSDKSLGLGAVQICGKLCTTMKHSQPFSLVNAKLQVKKLVPSLLQAVLTFL